MEPGPSKPLLDSDQSDRAHTSFVNALIFYDQSGKYARWILVCVFLSIGVLIGGVVLLSTKPADAEPETAGAENTDPAIRMRPARAGRTPLAGSGAAMGSGAITLDDTPKTSEDIRPSNEVVWDLGEDSDDEEENKLVRPEERREGREGREGEGAGESDDEGDGKGVGGIKESRGERGGLLLQTDEDDLEDRASPRPAPRRMPSKAEEDEAETFGAFASARQSPRP